MLTRSSGLWEAFCARERINEPSVRLPSLGKLPNGAVAEGSSGTMAGFSGGPLGL
ncbi:hypothetical protein RSSM_06764 [Rhodopirellula sallentina SM41]|uniref:Uncharacterized protein n=1 Tax=Rhodopirellula sallentina SM41 TaxID=1263870 RepID=M5TRH9_9BACT|nr:hypothetical protein RSSM_06764 [Rhodopirellula sallentina SM41]